MNKLNILYKGVNLTIQTTKELIVSQFDDLKSKHHFTCEIHENRLDKVIMLFDSRTNRILYDCNNLEEVFQSGKEAGAYLFEFSTFLLFCIFHELGHYYDYSENKDAFNYTNKSEYIAMELKGIKYAEGIVPDQLLSEFQLFNKISIEHYERDMNDAMEL
jgi:hypothetical protein